MERDGPTPSDIGGYPFRRKEWKVVTLLKVKFIVGSPLPSGLPSLFILDRAPRNAKSERRGENRNLPLPWGIGLSGRDVWKINIIPYFISKVCSECNSRSKPATGNPITRRWYDWFQFRCVHVACVWTRDAHIDDTLRLLGRAVTFVPDKLNRTDRLGGEDPRG